MTIKLPNRTLLRASKSKMRVVPYVLTACLASALWWGTGGHAHAAWLPVGPRPCGTYPGGYICSTSTQVRFAYPESWHSLRYTTPGLLTRSMIYLSTEPLSDPCVSTKEGAAEAITCDWPITGLGENGVLAEWDVGGKPGWQLSAVSGARAKVGGRPARIETGASGPVAEACRRIGADRFLSAWIARRVRSNFYRLVVCIRGPDFTTLKHEVHVLLASTRFPRG